MPINQIPVKLGWRKNMNTKSPAYGKYYPEVLNDKTISTRALLDHIMSHGLGIPRSIVSAVLVQLSECLTELMLQGQPVKLDGFGTFKLTAKTAYNGGKTDAQLIAGAQIRDSLQGLRMVVIPDNTDLDKLTSTANLEKAAISCEGVISKGDAGDDKTVKMVTPMAVWKEQQQQPNP